jgi:diguanylate cyclase (GGDEF)-like protein
MEQQAATKPRILVVDDSRLMRVAAKKILKEHFDIEEAADGEEAWERIAADPSFDVVMSDLSMPNLDGLGLLAKIRNAESREVRDLPVVVVTGAEDDTSAKEQALDKGASDFITKPFDSVQLVARAKAQVRLKEATEERDQKTEVQEKRAAHDPVSGLLTQEGFREAGEKALSYALRHDMALAVIRLEMLDFNKIFLRYRKEGAEQVIKATAQSLGQHLRREDYAGRIGMAQFALLLPACDLEGAKAIAQRIQAELSHHTQKLRGEAVTAEFNMGLVSPELSGALDWEAVLADAERELTRAKQLGRNQIAWPETEGEPPPPAASEPKAKTEAAEPHHGESEAEAVPEIPDLSLEIDKPDEQSQPTGAVEPSSPPVEDLSPTPKEEVSETAMPADAFIEHALGEAAAMIEPEPAAPETETGAEGLTLEPLGDTTPEEQQGSELTGDTSPDGGESAPTQRSPDFQGPPDTSLDLDPTGLSLELETSDPKTSSTPADETSPATSPQPSPGHAPKLETALAMIAAGDESPLEPHLDALIEQVWPLLELWVRCNDKPLEVSLDHLRQRLGGLHR